ncbi:hypothetical protein FFWV33_00920 [Flavobacterium faecale]|uniref:Lipopolysaccharide assembly protein A domain-containing protein n=1 Tax=Flavobacterium faecale TaxID=1355330 RepID=A0A2S1L8W4_9FLAO|nr:hypothetical protein [Flavobacterium faecale]AWG20185.1 hypothetical protein FFWV33_00920 [Flavobacterium faecale]
MRNSYLLGYLIIIVFLGTLNFELILTEFPFEFGFGTYQTYPFLLLATIGFVFCFLFFLSDKNKQYKNEAIIAKLHNEITIQQKDLEIAQLQASESQKTPPMFNTDAKV